MEITVLNREESISKQLGIQKMCNRGSLLVFHAANII